VYLDKDSAALLNPAQYTSAVTQGL
jgi:hypothetical protein